MTERSRSGDGSLVYPVYIIIPRHSHDVPESNALPPPNRDLHCPLGPSRSAEPSEIYGSAHQPPPHSIPYPQHRPHHGSDSTSGGNVPNNAIRGSTLAGVRGLPASAALASIRKSKHDQYLRPRYYSQKGQTHNRRTALPPPTNQVSKLTQPPGSVPSTPSNVYSPGVAVI